MENGHFEPKKGLKKEPKFFVLRENGTFISRKFLNEGENERHLIRKSRLLDKETPPLSFADLPLSRKKMVVLKNFTRGA